MSILVIARRQDLVDRNVSLIKADGFNAAGTVGDDEAVAKLDAGGISILVIGGGVEEASRERLKSLAQQQGVRVIEAAARGKSPEDYVRDELLPALRLADTSARRG